MTLQVPTRLSTDALVKRATLAALVGLLAAQWFSALTSCTVAVVAFYLLLIPQNTKG